MWGLSAEQIEEIKQRGEVVDHTTIRAPVGGVVIEKQGFEGMYVKTGTDRAEVGALTVDKWQRQGLATNIGTFLMEIAKTKDIKLFEGEILLSNFKLINLMKAMKIKYNKVISHGTLHFEIDLDEPFYE